MSFATDLLDGFPMLNKRTEETLKIAGEMSKFFTTIATCRKEYHKNLKAHLVAGHKKLLQEPELDGTVKDAFEAFLYSIEDTITGESKLTQQISDLAAEFAKFKKDNEGRKKKLQSDCDALMKEYNAQLETCKKSRSNYQALAREAEKQQQALAKGTSDPTIKSAKIAQMSQKTTQAGEKARSAEQEYREIVRQTNEKQEAVYTRDMPAILMEFQSFEEVKVQFMQESFKKYCAGAAAQPNVFQEAVNKINAATEAINASSDIASYVKSHATGKSCPPPLEVELYGGFDTSGIGAGASPASAPAGGSSSSSSNANQWGLSAADAQLSPSQKVSKLEGQISKLEGMIRADEQQASALERMSAAYAKDPVGKKKADAELAEFKDRINDNKGMVEKLRGDIASIQGEGASAEAPAAAPEGGEAPAAAAATDSAAAAAAPAEEGAAESNPVKVRGIYDYKASCDTELSFNEGDIFVVTLQDDSGWWYATIDDKQGFVPQNYVEVIQ